MGRLYCDEHQELEAIYRERKEKAKAERWRRADAKRGSARQRGYTSLWERERTAYIRRHPTCCDPSRRHGGQVKRTEVVDHIIPHRGDMKLFWDRNNWQPLCRSCHDHKTAQGQ